MDLLAIGAPDDEYATEVQMILDVIDQIGSVNQLADHIQHIFVTMFYEDDELFSIQKCTQIAKEIWVK